MVTEGTDEPDVLIKVTGPVVLLIWLMSKNSFAEIVSELKLPPAELSISTQAGAAKVPRKVTAGPSLLPTWLLIILMLV